MRGLLQVGEAVPDVTLTGQDGAKVRLRERTGRGVLVVYFYPKDDSPGCTAQSCALRDQYEDFLAAGADVIGISRDSAESHEAFASRHRLPYTLLSDASGEARQAFGVKSTLGLLPGRATFVVDRAGVVRHAFSSQLRVGEHVRGALEVVRRLAAEAAPAAGTAPAPSAPGAASPGATAR
jgi:peroxiredoxin Q/BCP